MEREERDRVGDNEGNGRTRMWTSMADKAREIQNCNWTTFL